MVPHSSSDPVAAEILRLTALRGADKSICPSEVARLLPGDPATPWQSHMPVVRRTAIALARQGLIDILRHGRPVADGAVAGGDIRGVIRLRSRTTSGSEQ